MSLMVMPPTHRHILVFPRHFHPCCAPLQNPNLTCNQMIFTAMHMQPAQNCAVAPQGLRARLWRVMVSWIQRILERTIPKFSKHRNLVVSCRTFPMKFVKVGAGFKCNLIGLGACSVLLFTRYRHYSVLYPRPHATTTLAPTSSATPSTSAP